MEMFFQMVAAVTGGIIMIGVCIALVAVSGVGLWYVSRYCFVASKRQYDVSVKKLNGGVLVSFD